jgi:hypothetical protein
MPRLDHAAPIVTKPAQILGKVLRERPPIKKSRSEQIHQVARHPHELAFASRFRQRKNRLEQMHVRVLKARSFGGHSVPVAAEFAR